MRAWSGFKTFIGFLIVAFIWSGTTAYLVGFCSVWDVLTYTVLATWILSILIDLLVLETLTEASITLFYALKDQKIFG